LYVGFGGFIGSVFRYLINVFSPSLTMAFPFVTMFINFFGSFLIGAITVFSAKIIPIEPRLMLMLTVGICGGFTTFSTFSLEVMNLLENGKFLLGTSYAILSILVCLLGVYLGRLLILAFAN
jgi:CrcB protein